MPHKIKKDNNGNKVDWNKRDEEILILVKKKYEELLNGEVPVRITVSSIGKSAEILAVLEKNLHKLPETEKFLKEIIETVEEFQIRRCKKIIDDKLKNQEEIKLWKLQRIAGIRTKDFKKIREDALKYIDMKRSNGEYEESNS